GWIPSLQEANVPFLGICYGHQLLAQAMGGKVDFHPKGKEIGTVDIHLLPESTTDPLFYALPPRFPVHVSHSQTVLSLPPGAVRLAANDFEPNHAFRLAPCLWGVQFHPEYDTGVMASYITEQADDLAAAGWVISERLSTVRETPVATGILRKFARIVGLAGS
ncbi:MAG: glutamine amidotransferase, partial [Deltaproteobacteria bacterium]|nr:glutamine amidotransferase [Deltaproteobacteria bacterium]